MTSAQPSGPQTILVVGCDVPQAAAAAALLAEWSAMTDNDIKVLAASQAVLPTLLDKAFCQSQSKGSRLIILGVPVRHDPATLALLRQALGQLRQRGVQTHWLGFAEHTAGDSGIAALWSEHIAASRTTFPAFVFRSLGCKHAPRRDISQMAELADSANRRVATAAELARFNLVRAALHDARQERRFDPYTDVIRTLAANVAETEAMTQMTERFKKFGHREFAGKSPAARTVCDLARNIGREGFCSVLITGETGVGKETIAYMIHEHSPRRDGPFIAFNCADLNPELLTSRLFGHEAGAFTGAVKKRAGVFEAADGGTVFLDEIGDLPLGAQAMLLRVLQEGRFNRLGAEAEEPTAVDVRVVAATHRDLRGMVKAGVFREDLFYRISAVCLQVPVLRERVEDLPAIAESYFRQRGWRLTLTPEQWAVLKRHAWPGNVREFQNALTRLHVLHETDVTKVLDSTPVTGIAESADETLDAAIRRHVRAVYEKHRSNKSRTAKVLGIAVNTLKGYLA